MKMIKRILFLATVTIAFVALGRNNIMQLSQNESKSASFNDLSGDYAWAQEAVSVLADKGAISGIEENVFSPKAQVTREQLAKMLVLALDLPMETAVTQTYIDIASTRWSFPYVEASKDFFPKIADRPINEFLPEEFCSREEVAATLIHALELDTSSVDPQKVFKKYQDADQVSTTLSEQVALACEKGILQGSDGLLRPAEQISRAEAAVFLYRSSLLKDGKEVSKKTTATSIAGKSTVSLEQAKIWAQAHNAHERFVNIADLYWKYGKETGIRPELLYAQAAKETNYGKYTGNVVPEQNNWAGIKTKDADGDKTEDHESFATPEDGVRAHFNHMAAYLGKEPTGATHNRYAVVVSASWAGSIQYAEELGGHWAPDPSYGVDLVNRYLVPMEETVLN